MSKRRARDFDAIDAGTRFRDTRGKTYVVIKRLPNDKYLVALETSYTYSAGKGWKSTTSERHHTVDGDDIRVMRQVAADEAEYAESAAGWDPTP